jgi:ADP-ribose pyrophosphatase YjhB (NUDIX family)
MSSSVSVRVAAIIIENNKLLMICHKKNNHEYYLLPGGKVEYMESLDVALKRELKEELNININVKDIAIVSDSIDEKGTRHTINICFMCDYVSGDYKIGDEDILLKYKFTSCEDLESLEIHPPINNELIGLLQNKDNNIYLGKLWKSN